MAGTVTREADGKTTQFSFWYIINAYTCAIQYKVIFEEEILTFKALVSPIPDSAALAYKSDTEEVLLYAPVSDQFTLTEKLLITIDSGDYVRPRGLFLSGKDVLAFNEEKKIIIVA